MPRLVLVFALLTLLAMPSTAAHAAAVLDRPTFTCGAGGATMRFTWRPAAGATAQYIDVSLADNGFAPGTFISAGPFDGAASSYTWTGMRPNVRHYYRVNALTPDGWQAASDTFTAPCRPAEVSLGGRDTPFNLFAGVYVLDVSTGATKRLIDTRGHTEFFGAGPSFDWSPDGSQVAVVLGSNGGLRVYDTAGAVKAELDDHVYAVDWLTPDRIGVYMRRGGFEGEEGHALVDAATGAGVRFLPYVMAGTWSPDGERIAFMHMEPGQRGRSLFVRDVATGTDRFLGSDEFSQFVWSPDGRMLAGGISDAQGERTVVIDATTGAEVLRSNASGYDFDWSPDSRSVAMTGYGETDQQRVIVLGLDGSTRSLAQGTRPRWSPDSGALTFLRDGSLWLVTLGDGVESPLLRPQLPVVVEHRWSPTGDKIAFRASGSSGGVYLMRSDGSEERYVSPGGTVNWSPKGDRLALVYGEGALGFAGNVFTMTPRATGINRLGSVFSGDVVLMCWNGPRFDWSPDGSSIAYWTQDSSGTAVRVVRDQPNAAPASLGQGTGPAWSPDGTRIAFSSAAPQVANQAPSCQVSTVAPGGGDARAVSQNAQGPRWSPDGAWLAVESTLPLQPFMPNRIRVVAADGSGQRAEFPGSNPAWSPDGKQIAFTRSSWTGGSIAPPHTSRELVVVNADGSAPRVLAEALFLQFDWSPDGTSIVFAATGQDKSLMHVIELATGDTKVLGEGRSPSWSPDGEWIAFTR